jgi:hypothetical protein
MDEKIQVRIFPDGRIEAETKGVKGEKCTDYITILEKLLNAQAVKAEYTKEFYETEQIDIPQTLKQQNKT